MADNTTLSAGTADGDVIATDDVGGVKFALAQLVTGGDSAAKTLVDGSNGLPVGVVDALPAGSNTIGVVDLGAVDNAVLDAIAASAAVMDDWDESDRAKVNPIVGQAGVAAGAGAVDALTQRVTLASDDPAVAALQILDNAISGSEMQVDVVGALPAGTNNIGDVDVLSLASAIRWKNLDAEAAILDDDELAPAGTGLADGAQTALSAEIDNEAGLDTHMDVELVLASINPSGAPYVLLYLIPSLDVTNFQDLSTSMWHRVVANMPVTTGASAKRVGESRIPIPPLKFKVAVENRTGVSFANSGNTLSYSRYSLGTT